MRSQLLVSGRLFKALLRLYPREFNAAYGEPMRLAFRDACREAYYRGGAAGLLRLWLPTLLDLVKSALEERARQGEINMSKDNWIALAGPLTILVGTMWLAAFTGLLVLLTRLAPIESFWADFWFFTFFASFIPLLFALVGTRLRFHQAAGPVGRLGLALSVAGGAGLTAFALASLLDRAWPGITEQVSWIVYLSGASILGLMAGHILFGVDAVRRRLLPRWNGLPLLAGSGIVFVFATIFLKISGDHPLVVLPFVITGACWVLLGVVLIDKSQRQAVAAN